ncbi:MAG TPA: PHB depolymerase family esterase [Acidimicrobiales bacterium]|nr:PHB depolymerase family esterase [Acidimicrobiales bacterium]
MLAVLALVAASSCSSAKNAASSSTTTAANTATTAPVASPACPAAKPSPAGQSTVHLTFGGADRDYVLYVPRSYTGTFAVPVVFNFHGFGSNASQQMAYGDFRPLAEKNAFLIVAPDGEDATIGRHFNVAQAPGQPDDVGFALAIVDSLEKDFCVDARRIYSAGMSDGGAMTSLLACVASNRFAAFGPVAVVFYNPACGAARSVPIAAFMGNADPVVPFNGGQVNCCGGATVPAAPTSMAGWASHDKCASQPHEQSLGSEVTLRQWTGCAPQGDVRFYIINGGGHTWPGSIDVRLLGKTTHQINASDELWTFFQAHPLP